jgi:transposase-like protein
MNRTVFSEELRAKVLAEYQALPQGVSVEAMLKKHGVSFGSFYRWLKLAGIKPAMRETRSTALVKSTSKALDVKGQRRARRSHTEHFKRTTVAKYLSRPPEVTIVDFARRPDVDVTPGLLRLWVDKYPPSAEEAKAARREVQASKPAPKPKAPSKAKGEELELAQLEVMVLRAALQLAKRKGFNTFDDVF